MEMGNEFPTAKIIVNVNSEDFYIHGYECPELPPSGSRAPPSDEEREQFLYNLLKSWTEK